MMATPWALDELSIPETFELSDAEMDAAADATASIDLHAHFAAERTRLEAESYERGYQDAVQEMRADAEARMAAGLSALSDALASVQLHEARWIANAEENVAALSIAVARHIVQREVTTDATIVRDLVQRALISFPIDQGITVRLHPADAETCSSTTFVDGKGREQDVRLVADAHIARGGCLVEGRERIIDGRVDTSLERAYRSIGQIQA